MSCTVFRTYTRLGIIRISMILNSLIDHSGHSVESPEGPRHSGLNYSRLTNFNNKSQMDQTELKCLLYEAQLSLMEDDKV